MKDIWNFVVSVGRVEGHVWALLIMFWIIFVLASYSYIQCLKSGEDGAVGSESDLTSFSVGGMMFTAIFGLMLLVSLSEKGQGDVVAYVFLPLSLMFEGFVYFFVQAARMRDRSYEKAALQTEVYRESLKARR